MAERFEIVEKALLAMLDEKKYSTLRDILVTMNPSDVAGLFRGPEEKQIPETYPTSTQDFLSVRQEWRPSMAEDRSQLFP